MQKLNSLLSTKPFKPTLEQADVIESAKSGNNLIVKAFAGSGKTATAVEAATASGRRGRMILFNNAARRDAAARMPAHVKTSTGHSLAHDLIIKPSPLYQKKLEYTLNSRQQRISPNVFEQYLAINDLPHIQCSARHISTAVIATLNSYLISDNRKPSQHHVPKNASPLHLRLNNQSALAEFTGIVLQYTGQAWQAMQDEHSPFPITHDAYIKILHLREVEISMPEETWYLDEYQDTNPVLDHIIGSQAGQKVYIGDPFQQIYRWRGASNAIQKRIDEGLTVKHLSQSFRFNNQIAGTANILLQSLGETVPIVGQPYNMDQFDHHRGHTVLVRNNLTMLWLADYYARRRQKVFIPGGIPLSAQMKAESALALYENRIDDVRIGALKQLGSWAAFKDAANSLGNEFPEYSELIELVHQHGARIPALIKACKASWEEVADDWNRVTMMTAHRAKGREWKNVRLCDDLALPEDLIKKLTTQSPVTESEREQVNLLYVSITRCKQSVMIPSEIKSNLKALDDHQKRQEFSQAYQKESILDQDTIAARTADFIANHRKQ